MRKTLTLKAIHSLLCMSLEAEGKSTLLKRHSHSYLSQSCHGSAMLGISLELENNRSCNGNRVLAGSLEQVKYASNWLGFFIGFSSD